MRGYACVGLDNPKNPITVRSLEGRSSASRGGGRFSKGDT